MSMLHTSEQFETKQLMECHENVARRDKQTRASSSRSSADDDDKYLCEASRLSEHDRELG